MNNKNLLERTVAKMERSQQKKKEIVEYMEQHKPHLLGSKFRNARIRDCCNVLIFRDYLNGEQKLYRANFCKYDKFCLACSTRRSIRMIQRFLKGIEQYNLKNKHRYHITLTVKHNKNQSLKMVLDKLCIAKEKLGKNYRNGKRNSQKKKSFMNNFDGIVSSIEVTHSEKSGWHPHIHILACSDNVIPIEVTYPGGKLAYINRDLQKERYKITGDSYQISIREVNIEKGHFDRSGIGEVFKYAVKFSTLDVPHLVELIELQHSRKYHFFSTYGIFRGWKLDGKDTTEDKEFIERTLEYYKDEYVEIDEPEQQSKASKVVTPQEILSYIESINTL